MTTGSGRVVMLLRNAFTRDARVAREAETLVQAGYDVTVVCLKAPGLPVREERNGYLIARDVDPGRFGGPTVASETAGSRERVPDRAPAERAHGRPPFRPPAAVWARDRLFEHRFQHAAEKHGADVVHAHDLNTLRPAIHAARAHGAKLVYDAHELYPELTGFSNGERARWRRIERRDIGAADLVIAPSSARAAEMQRRYGLAIAPSVVMNCPRAPTSAPDPAASPLSALRLPGETLLVYAGGYTPNRGLVQLMEATRALPSVRLALVGWGPSEHQLRAAAHDRVEFLPPVEHEAVVPFVAGADIGIVSYQPVGLNNKLASPNKVFEYLHAGIAICGSDLPDIRAIVEGHQVGALFDAGDVASITRAIESVIADPVALQRMRANARAAAPSYTWEAQADELRRLYRAL